MAIVAGSRTFLGLVVVNMQETAGACHLELTIQTSMEHGNKIRIHLWMIRRSEQMVRVALLKYIVIYTHIFKYMYVCIYVEI
jgi:hypothetical protein